MKVTISTFKTKQNLLKRGKESRLCGSGESGWGGGGVKEKRKTESQMAATWGWDDPSGHFSQRNQFLINVPVGSQSTNRVGKNQDSSPRAERDGLCLQSQHSGGEWISVQCEASLVYTVPGVRPCLKNKQKNSILNMTVMPILMSNMFTLVLSLLSSLHTISWEKRPWSYYTTQGNSWNAADIKIWMVTWYFLAQRMINQEREKTVSQSTVFQA